jgi:hypothetical protein
MKYTLPQCCFRGFPRTKSRRHVCCFTSSSSRGSSDSKKCFILCLNSRINRIWLPYSLSLFSFPKPLPYSDNQRQSLSISGFPITGKRLVHISQCMIRFFFEKRVKSHTPDYLHLQLPFKQSSQKRLSNKTWLPGGEASSVKPYPI